MVGDAARRARHWAHEKIEVFVRGSTMGQSRSCRRHTVPYLLAFTTMCLLGCQGLLTRRHGVADRLASAERTITPHEAVSREASRDPALIRHVVSTPRTSAMKSGLTKSGFAIAEDRKPTASSSGTSVVHPASILGYRYPSTHGKPATLHLAAQLAPAATAVPAPQATARPACRFLQP